MQSFKQQVAEEKEKCKDLSTQLTSLNEQLKSNREQSKVDRITLMDSVELERQEMDQEISQLRNLFEEERRKKGKELRKLHINNTLMTTQWDAICRRVTEIKIGHKARLSAGKIGIDEEKKKEIDTTVSLLLKLWFNIESRWWFRG